MDYDFSLNNPAIKDFFEGKGSFPLSEFKYLHEHPLVKPNFVQEINDMVPEMEQMFISRNIPSDHAFIQKLLVIGIRIGNLIPKIGEDSSTQEILLALKDLYALVKEVKAWYDKQ
jgi:hypothetical protein